MIRVSFALPAPDRAEVAQLVEHVTENHGVGSSILPLGTNISAGGFAPPHPPTRSLARFGSLHKNAAKARSVRVGASLRSLRSGTGQDCAAAQGSPQATNVRYTHAQEKTFTRVVFLVGLRHVGAVLADWCHRAVGSYYPASRRVRYN